MAMTIKELARDLNCSYENVRLFLKRYEKELSEHVSKNGRTQLLDDFACEFIRTKRTENPVTVQTIEKDEYTKELERENKTLLLAVNELQNELLRVKEDKHALELENVELKLLKAKEEPKKKRWWRR